MAYWLMKSEPDEFSISDLQLLGKARWDVVR
ncbi:EVE domain-containing protein, partial [Pseudomonas syringae]